MSRASYLSMHHSGELARRVAQATALLHSCTLCPRRCEIDRHSGALGVCTAGASAEIASIGPHFGEEQPLVGVGGSGTVFMSGCNLRCVFCQNYDISQQAPGAPLSPAELGERLLDLQEQGCHNINFVTPSHQLPAILAAVDHAAAHGLVVPLVYNTSGYDTASSLQLLEGIFDIYMPDLKTLDEACAERYLRAADYPAVVKAAIAEMHRQVGDLVVDQQGIAVRGLVLRHLVMPGDVAHTRAVLQFLRDEISPNTYVNIMGQYHGAGETRRYPEIDRSIQAREYAAALKLADEIGMTRLDQRRRASLVFRPL